MKALSRDQIRNLDRIAVERFGIPGMVLMENAGRGAVEVLLRRLLPRPEDRIAVLAGRGNNGGDGFVMARHLVNRGFRAEILLLGRRTDFRGETDAGRNFSITEKMEIPIQELPAMDDLPRLLSRADFVVDALLGTGLSGPVRGAYAEAIEALNLAPAPAFAVDVPSGLDADAGRPLGVAVRARATATFAAMKTGLLEEFAREYTGPVEVVDIGAPVVWE
jgi:NAD(P)H-hydrate epimerase